MSEAITPNVPKEQRINKANLKNIGFEQVDKYEDPEIGYTVYAFKEIEVTVEKEKWYCEIVKGREGIPLKGITSLLQIAELKTLIYGN
jgi:hypothetical protein